MECLNDALVACVKALGGSKKVGPMLWPEKGQDAAQRALLDCLNPDRLNRLTPEQVAFLMRRSRQIGFHDAAAWLMADLGYSAPIPLAPEEEQAELQRQFIQATNQMADMMGRLQSLQAEIDSPRMRAVR